MANPKKKRINRLRVLKLAFVVICVFVAVTFAGRLYGLYQRSVDLAEARARQSDLEEECAKLEEENALLEDEEYITRFARENWVFTKDGETVIPLPEDAASSNKEE